MKTKNSPIWVALVGALALVLLMIGVVYAATVTLDSYDYGTENLIVTTATPVLTALYDGSGMLGGERDSVVNWVGGSGQIKLKVDGDTTYGVTFLRFDQESGVSGRSQIVWDGNDDDATTVNYTGLGGVDLTGGGTNDGFLVSIYFNDLKVGITFKVYTNSSNWSQYQFTLPGALDGTPARMDIFLPFSGFSTGGGSGATFSNVGAVVMELDGTVTAGADTLIDFIEATTAREYGDLPVGVYGTTILGAYHIPQGVRLGKNVDAESTYNSSTGADGDDNNPTRVDDEDGVQPVLTPWPAGGTGYVEVSYNGCPAFPSACYVNGWIDWNNNGNFGDTGEKIISNYVVFGNGSAYPPFSVPSGYSNGYYYARFRICTTNTACDDPGESPVTNGEVEDYRWPLGPTAVEITSFTATPDRGGIQVAWETGDETDLVGFNLLRQAGGGEYLQLNQALIQAQHPGQPLGAAYTWPDGGVLGGVAYSYELEVLEAGGHSYRFGPVSATAHYRLYLPVVLK